MTVALAASYVHTHPHGEATSAASGDCGNSNGGSVSERASEGASGWVGEGLNAFQLQTLRQTGPGEQVCRSPPPLPHAKQISAFQFHPQTGTAICLNEHAAMHCEIMSGVP